jgi:hypothetical protein
MEVSHTVFCVHADSSLLATSSAWRILDGITSVSWTNHYWVTATMRPFEQPHVKVVIAVTLEVALVMSTRQHASLPHLQQSAHAWRPQLPQPSGPKYLSLCRKPVMQPYSILSQLAMLPLHQPEQQQLTLCVTNWD